MKRDNKGIKPQDILLLAKLISENGAYERQVDLALSLGISQAEIANSLDRLKKVGLIDESKRRVNKLSAIEFFKHAIKFIFPVEVEGVARGVRSGPSADFVKKEIKKDDFGYVWEDPEGESRGVGVKPIYPTLVKAIENNHTLYKLICLIDILRGLGGNRHRKFAEEKIVKMIMEITND